jgi:6-phosphogluconate dehydrogenase
MQLGMVGLGRMGANMTTRLLQGGHEVVAYDVNPAAVTTATEGGAVGVAGLAELVQRLTPPRVVWVMVPAGPVTEETVAQLISLLDAGDCIIDGGNSRWTQTQAHANTAADQGIAFVDAGTSGGVWGLAEGYCLMLGGDTNAVQALAPVLDTLAPPDGWAHVGPAGAGHYTKMVHNGIEYALMQAYAEGFELLERSEYDIDLAQVAQVWRRGSVVRSWLLDLAAEALTEDPGLEGITGYVEDSGEGRWTVEAAISAAVPTPTIAMALFARFASRQPDAFANRMLAALRNQFGGHAVRPRTSEPE